MRGSLFKEGISLPVFIGKLFYTDLYDLDWYEIIIEWLWLINVKLNLISVRV